MAMQDWREQDFEFLKSDNVQDIMRGLPYVLLGIVIGMALFNTDLFSFAMNSWTEALSIIVTVFILDRRAERRAYRDKVEELKARLIREAGSPVNNVARQAINELRNHGWLTGDKGALKGAKLRYADLRGTNLDQANLIGADLDHVNLNNTSLEQTNLSEASLRGADLSNVNFRKVNLRSAILTRANLNSVELWESDLTGANLRMANLSNSTIYEVNLTSADLKYAKLQNSEIIKANFYNANLEEANLRNVVSNEINFDRAKLYRVNLQGAILFRTSFANAELISADFRGADLLEASFTNSFISVNSKFKFQDTSFDETTTLPNGEKWISDTDMTQFGAFTDELDYWQWRASQQQITS